MQPYFHINLYEEGKENTTLNPNSWGKVGFGQNLRRDSETPAKKAMAFYFIENDKRKDGTWNYTQRHLA